MRKIFLYLVMLLSLTACWWKQVQSFKLVSFWQFSFNISDKFSQVNNKKTIKDFKILYTYNAKDLIKWNDSESSLVILKYIGDYPKDKKEFFSIVSNKFKREIPGTKIIEKSKFKKNDDTIYYFTYKVYDNLFTKKEEKADHYGLQAYVFSKDKLYVISYVSSSTETIKIMLDNIEDLHVNK